MNENTILYYLNIEHPFRNKLMRLQRTVQTYSDEMAVLDNFVVPTAMVLS